jgi:hypothetical protein
VEETNLVSESIWTWLAALNSLALWSIPIKESPFSRAGEFVYVGLGAGVALFSVWNALYTKGISPMIGGDWLLIVPMILGLIVLLRPFIGGPFRSIAIWPLAMVLGYGIGSNVAGLTISQIWKPLLSTATIKTGDWLAVLTSIVIIVVFSTVLFSFTSTVEHTGIIGSVASIGRWWLVAAFGLAFGRWMMSRMGFIAARVQFFIYTWLQITPIT